MVSQFHETAVLIGADWLCRVKFFSYPVECMAGQDSNIVSQFHETAVLIGADWLCRVKLISPWKLSCPAKHIPIVRI